MAKYVLYSVYDTKVKFFHKPMFMRNKGEALRSWKTEANADPEKSSISAHPSDFDLFEIGEFDDDTAKFEMHPSPISLGLAVHYKESPEQPTSLFGQKA